MLTMLPLALAAAKCGKAPKSVQNVQLCCPLPLPNWGAYNSECAQSGTQASCRLACIFNAAGALQGNQLNLPRVRPMLERAFGNQQIIDAYDLSFASCGAVVRQRYSQLAKLSSQSDACDRHALFYSLCAYSKLMKHCPSANWQRHNQDCRKARTYVTNCAWPALQKFFQST
ncbi:uncharacterized protein LOC108595956 [Drosophila busckii]|nr:uncharacterized protein LOC108595956 [Drosophila busckii]